MSHGIAKDAPILTVVLNWNGAKTLNDTLRDLSKQIAVNQKILVIDNHSTDGSIDALKTEYPHIDLLQLDDNLGFARGNNEVLFWNGWREFDWKKGWLFLSNNDVLYEPDMLERLQKVGEDNEDAVSISPWIAYAEPRDRLWFGGAMIYPVLGIVGHRRLRQKYAGKEDGGIETTDYATACSVLIPTRYFFEVGGFDRGFPHYAEDGDLSLRLKEKYGGECYVLRKTLAYHRVSASIGGSAIKYRWRTTAYVKFLRTHFRMGKIGIIPYLFVSVITAGMRMGSKGAMAAWQGWWDGIRNKDNAIAWERPQ